MRKIITVANNAQHQDPFVGKHWKGQCGKTVYHCDQYQTGLGYQMTNTSNPADRHHVMEHEVLRRFTPAQ